MAEPSAPSSSNGSNKPNWPKTKTGTVDWETVFENGETGLLRQIERARTPQALREIALTLIPQLFARKGDDEETARLSAELTELIADGMTAEQFAAIADAVSSTFRDIKVFRQKKAAEYELAQKGKTSEAERRKATQQQQSIKQTLARKRRRRIVTLASFGVVFVIICSSLFFYLREPPPPARADQILLQQMRSAAAGGPTGKHVYGGALQTRRYFSEVTISAENVPVNACITVGLALMRDGTFTVNGETLQHASAEAARSLCTAATAPIRVSWTPVL